MLARRLPDLAVLLMLVATGTVAALPFLTDGYLTYLDNPVHIAEIQSLAFDAKRGWSDLSYGGFALGQLQSPLWYGLAALVVRAGIPVEPLYITLVFLAFLAPSLALYAIARRSLPPILAGLLSGLFLLQRPFLVGTGSVLGGMWTFGLALAGIVLLLDRLARTSRNFRDTPAIAALVATVGLTHVFGLMLLAIVAPIHALISLVTERAVRRPFVLDAFAFAIGTLASAPNWLPLLLARNMWSSLGTENLDAARLWQHLIGTADTLGHRLAEGSAAIFRLDVGLQWLLLLAGLAGALFAFSRRASEASNAPRYAVPLGATLGVLLFIVLPGTQIAVLGPLSWRFVAVIRLTLAICAIPLFEHFRLVHPPLRFRPVAVAVAAALMLTVGAISSVPLRMHTARQSSAEMRDFSAAAAKLSEARRPAWGRVFVQDTFFSSVDSSTDFTRATPALLRYSHIGALMPHLAGIHAVGAYYGAIPVSTPSLASEFDTLFGQPSYVWSAEMLAAKFDDINVTHVLVCDSNLGGILRLSNLFTPLFDEGRFGVFARTGAHSSFVRAGTGVTMLGDERYATGEVSAVLHADRFGRDLRVLTGYHPFWLLDSPSSARLEHENGMLLVRNLPAGISELRLRFQPPRAPGLLALSGWACIAVLALAALRRSPSRAIGYSSNAAGVSG